MKHFPKYLLLSLATFFCGFAAVSVWFFHYRKSPPAPQPEIVIQADAPLAEVTINAVEPANQYRAPLDDVWLEDEKVSYGDYLITNRCAGTQADDDCKLRISKHGKVLKGFDSRSDWLKYGFFNFLGAKDKQLIVETYSGGAHCCSDYAIYDLKPTFRVLYDSTDYDSANDVGNNLTPVDIDGDGVFEFERSVMRFDYFHASHADSVFPPAVFAYDARKGRYVFANKKFSDFVLDELKKNLDWLERARRKDGNVSEALRESDERYVVRKTFFNMVYAGEREEAWRYFDEKYNFGDKEEFRRDVKKEFAVDAAYRSIYNK